MIKAIEQERILNTHLHRARKANLPATLTLDRWLMTLNHFGWKCAYCQEKEYQVLEHFMPLSLGGGTTADNCVPSCRSCNVTKREWNPFELPLDFFVFSTAMQRIDRIAPEIHQYLQTCEGEVHHAS